MVVMINILLWAGLLCCCWLWTVEGQTGEGGAPVILAYEIQGATHFPEANARFYCTKPALCFSQLSATRRLKLYRTSVYLSPQENQVRWYIEDITSATRSSGNKVYGAIELNAFPLQLKSWKRIQTGAASVEDIDMTLKPFSLSCQPPANDVLMDAVLTGRHMDQLLDKMDLLHFLMFKVVDKIEIVSTELLQSIFAQCQSQLIHTLTSIPTPTRPMNPIETTLQLVAKCELQVLQGNAIEAQRCIQSLQQSTNVSPLRELLASNNAGNIAQDSWLDAVDVIRLRHHVASALERLLMFQIVLHQDPSLWTESLRDAFFCSNPSQSTEGNPMLVIASYLAGDYVSWSLVHASDAKIVIFQSCPFNAASKLHANVIPLSSVVRALEQLQQYLMALPNDGSKQTLQAIFYKVQFYFQKLQSLVDEVSRNSPSELSESTPQQTLDEAEKWLAIASTDVLQQEYVSFLQHDYHVTYSTSLVHSLLAVGAVQTAANHITQVVTGMTKSFLQQQQDAQSSDVDILRGLLVKYEVDCMFETSSPSLEVKLSKLISTSSNVQSLLTLATLMQKDAASVLPILTRDPDLFHAFLSTATQIASPVILTTSTQDQDISWLDEAISLRVLMLEMLNQLQTYCQSTGDGSRCYLRADGQSAGVRGLFLEAYQGLALLHSYLATAISSLPQERNTCFQKLLTNVKLLDYQCTYQYIDLLRSVQTLPEILPSVSPTNGEILLSTTSPKKLRVGFMSYSLTRHSVGRLLSMIIAYLSQHEDALSIEIYIISNINATTALNKMQSTATDEESDEDRHKIDDVTKYLLTVIPSDRWIVLPMYVYDPLFASTIDTIHEIALDCVVYTDILMQPYIRIWSHRIRLAKVQLAFWGHPYSTGDGDWIDYFITSDLFEAHSHQQSLHRSQQFDEQLVAFDSLSFQLFPAEAIANSLPSSIKAKKTKPAAVNTPSSTEERQNFLEWLFLEAYDIYGRKGSEQMRSFYRVLYHHTHTNSDAASVSMKTIVEDVVQNTRIYGSLQSLMKMHPMFDDAIVQLLLHDANAVVVLLRTPKQSEWQASFQQRLLRHIQELTNAQPSINVQKLTERIFFVNQLPHSQYARIICQLDVALDPFPFGGGVTMCDAIAGHCPRHGNNASSIPFITSGYLQSVHHIASGISQTIGNYNVARDSDRTCDYLLESIAPSTASIPQDFAKHTQQLVGCYVREAIDVATHSQTAYLNHEQQEVVGQAGRDPYEVIYKDLEVVAREWSRFLHRVAM